MTTAAIGIAETVRLWEDPEARWALGRDSCPSHPAGEIVLPSVSGPCSGYGSFADDRR